jgi:Leucine-rich repeat (LRR) protein
MGEIRRLKSVLYRFLCCALVVTFLLVILGPSGCAPVDEQIVSFPDPNLQAVIREAIGKPTGNIYKIDLEGLASLDASGKSIVDLTGLEHVTSLTHLYLLDNQISDISALANLPSLIELYIGWNQISDISAIAGLTSLTVLNLDSNQIGNLSALASLTSLRELHLDGNQISDISALANLTSLKELYLYSNQISDISALANFTSLTTLELGENQISDILTLVANTGLGEGDYVDLTDNSLSDTSIYTYIPQLQARGVTVLY